jgi:hypothetical protein
VRFYAVLGAATVIASVIEIAFLYWDGLRSVHQLAHAAGLDLFPETENDDAAVAAAMARAALELPNPIQNLFGVNPRREASRLRLIVASLVYKAKISVTNFLVKMLVRRTVGRAFVRSWLPFVAVPLTAAWNGVVCRLIIREARIRAMGPSAAKEMLDVILEAHGRELGREAADQQVGLGARRRRDRRAGAGEDRRELARVRFALHLRGGELFSELLHLFAIGGLIGRQRQPDRAAFERDLAAVADGHAVEPGVLDARRRARVGT